MAEKQVPARLEMTADNSFTATLNGTPVLEGGNFNEIYTEDVTKAMKVLEGHLEPKKGKTDKSVRRSPAAT